MKVIGWITCGLLALVAMLGLTWLAQGNEFFLMKVFAPRVEQVRRETFEQSKAFNQGMIQELQNMQFEYGKATDDQKSALASVILHRAADYDESKMPADLRSFVDGLRNERTK